MKIYFGKISSKFEKAQIEQGYYKAPKDSSWFNGIQPGDYSFTIGGGKIQLWQAKEWSKKDGSDILKFDIIYKDLEINTKQLTAIKYFTMTMELVVLTVRSTAKSKKAFYPIEFTKNFSEMMLRDINIYKDNETFRLIHLLDMNEKPSQNSENLQLYKDEKTWQLYPSSFISKNILNAFQDNTAMLGSGQPNKDKTIRKIINPSNEGRKLPPEELSILQIYDLFCCDYRSKETTEIPGDEIESDLDILNYESSNIIIYGPPGTGKTYDILSLIEELDTNEKVGVQIKPKDNLNLNKTFWHLAPGRNGYLWDKLKKGTYLGYEWCDKSYGDLKKLDPKTENYKIRRRFSEVRKGDYFSHNGFTASIIPIFFALIRSPIVPITGSLI